MFQHFGKLRKFLVVYNKSDVLRINVIIAVDRTILAPASEVYPRPDNDFWNDIC